MSGFSTEQLKKLRAKLDRARVRSRSVDGKQLDYIEGWFALSEANAIFGYANWDRETVHFERLFERSRGEVTACAYVTRVRLHVRAGRTDQLSVKERAAGAHLRVVQPMRMSAPSRPQKPMRPSALSQHLAIALAFAFTTRIRQASAHGPARHWKSSVRTARSLRTGCRQTPFVLLFARLSNALRTAPSSEHGWNAMQNNLRDCAQSRPVSRPRAANTTPTYWNG